MPEDKEKMKKMELIRNNLNAINVAYRKMEQAKGYIESQKMVHHMVKSDFERLLMRLEDCLSEIDHAAQFANTVWQGECQ